MRTKKSFPELFGTISEGNLQSFFSRVLGMKALLELGLYVVPSGHHSIVNLNLHIV